MPLPCWITPHKRQGPPMQKILSYAHQSARWPRALPLRLRAAARLGSHVLRRRIGGVRSGRAGSGASGALVRTRRQERGERGGCRRVARRNKDATLRRLSGEPRQPTPRVDSTATETFRQHWQARLQKRGSCTLDWPSVHRIPQSRRESQYGQPDQRFPGGLADRTVQKQGLPPLHHLRKNHRTDRVLYQNAALSFRTLSG